MLLPDPAVDAYVEQVPAPARPGVALLRDLCRRYLPGFTEEMRYGMPGYRREGGDIEVAFAAQKRYLSFYVRTDVLTVHRPRLPGLSIGKSCVRYRRPDQLDAAVVRSILEQTAATERPVC